MTSPPRGPHLGPTVLALILSIVAIIVELSSHLCAQAFFDPLPNPLSIGAYVFLTACIAFNARLLAYGDLDFTDKRERLCQGIAVVLSGAGLCIALVYSLMFMPILPASFLGLLFWGVGLCAWSPLFNLIILLLQVPALIRRWEGRVGEPSGRLKLASVGAALAAFTVLVGHPLAIGFFYQRALTAEPREPSLSALRRLGAAHIVHDLGYEEKAPVWVSVGQGLAGSSGNSAYALSDGLFGPSALGSDRASARKLYVLLTGQSFESAPWGPPKTTAFDWDRTEPAIEERGGEAVGHAVDGVSLASSRIDGVIDRDTETAYQEWTLEFRNSSAADAEARAELLLPEGGVINKVSLRINGEERPAAFGPRSVVRQAYQDVAVVQQRDPLLVTAKRPDRAMIQCSPILPGRTMKIRLGITSPLAWRNRASPELQLDLPSLQHVNFRLPNELKHEIWIEGRWRTALGRLHGDGWNVADASKANAQFHTARRSLPAGAILAPPPLEIRETPAPSVGDRLGAGMVRTAPPFSIAQGPVDLYVVLDTSRGMDLALKSGVLAELMASISELPTGSQVCFVDGREAEGNGTPKTSPWASSKQVGTLLGWLDQRRYEGGIAPAPAVRWAWEQALTRPTHPAAVLWIHGAVSADVVDASALQQSLDRRPGGPPLVAVQLKPGPDALLDEIAASPRVYALFSRPKSNSIATAVQLAAAVAAIIPNEGVGLPLGGRPPALNGATFSGGAASGYVRPLAAAAEALNAWYSDPRNAKTIATAQKHAIRSRVVTPLSGAVVLETKEQYDRHQLSDRAEEGTIPSVPEPGTLALLALAGAACAAVKRRRSGHPEGAQEIAE